MTATRRPSPSPSAPSSAHARGDIVRLVALTERIKALPGVDRAARAAVLRRCGRCRASLAGRRRRPIARGRSRRCRSIRCRLSVREIVTRLHATMLVLAGGPRRPFRSAGRSSSRRTLRAVHPVDASLAGGRSFGLLGACRFVWNRLLTTTSSIASSRPPTPRSWPRHSAIVRLPTPCGADIEVDDRHAARRHATAPSPRRPSPAARSSITTRLRRRRSSPTTSPATRSRTLEARRACGAILRSPTSCSEVARRVLGRGRPRPDASTSPRVGPPPPRCTRGPPRSPRRTRITGAGGDFVAAGVVGRARHPRRAPPAARTAARSSERSRRGCPRRPAARSSGWPRTVTSTCQAHAARLLEDLRDLTQEPLTIDVLGPLRLREGNTEISAAELRRGRVRTLLALLVLRGPLRRERICDLLWPDLEPEAAAQNLRVTLSRLRRLLEPDLPAGRVHLEDPEPRRLDRTGRTATRRHRPPAAPPVPRRRRSCAADRRFHRGDRLPHARRRPVAWRSTRRPRLDR